MRTWFARTGFAVLTIVLVAVIILASWEPFSAKAGPAPDSDRAYEAEIVRGEFGVPHIYGKTDADVAFGVAIAHAEDDFFTLQDTVAMARGRYGAIAGEDGAAVDYVYHLLDARGTAEREYPALPADTRALFEAYATGLNQYAKEHPGEVKLARLFPVNGQDVAAGFALRQPFFFGIANIIQPLVEGTDLRPEHGPPIPADRLDPNRSGPPIMEDGEPAETTAATARPMPLPWGEDGAMSGSNAWAIAPEKSGDGVTRLVSNAHQPWRGGVAWYELVVESEEGWHFAGANFPGSPLPFLGHNENLGWTNTVNTPDMVDIYRLDMREDGSQYRLDGEWLDLERETVILPVRLGPIVLPIPQEVLRSVHGPVIANDRGHFAIRYGGMGNLKQLDAYYRLNKARDFAEWRAQLARLDIPSTNFVYADREGNIGYFYNAALPERAVGYDWRTILPGDESAAIWQETVDFDTLPQIVNPASGWLYNANNTPYSAAGRGSDLSRDAFAPELGVELKMTNRARRAAKLLEAADTIDRATLEAIKYDTRYERAGYLAQMLDEVAALELNDDDLISAQRLLAEWDLSADSVGEGDSIALLMIRPYMSASYTNGTWPDALQELERSTQHLMTHFGRLDPPMADLLRLRQGDVDLPLDGGSDTLRASTTWDVDDDGRLSVRHGDSFIQFVEWSPGERVRSESVVPFGAASTRPRSVHYTDQSPLFIRHALKPVHFWRTDVAQNAVRRKTVKSGS